MKKLLFTALMMLASLGHAESRFEFSFKENNDVKTLEADGSQLTYIGESPKWILVANWQGRSDNNAIRLLHSLTQFRETKIWDQTGIKYDRIWTYGYIDCRLNQLFILNEFYTNNLNEVILDTKFSPSEYIVDLDMNIVLQTLYIFACKSESI